ncbi:MAG: hypothetical protein GKS00_11455 [Alphaproteobacteria bacterium]|nr:hypothetical protein [Alphaproteobacteria bacterium]
MTPHRKRIEFFRANRVPCLAGAAALAVVIALAMVFVIDLSGLRSPEDSAALKQVRNVSLSDIGKTGSVPPAFIKRIDVDLAALSTKERKQAFFRMILPLVARENGRIRAERKSLTGAVPNGLFKRYDVTKGDLETLRKRVDVIPTSLVLAQAALESGWGTSRFVLDGNNLFGMRTYDDDTPGLKPAAARGFKVMRFKSLGESVAAYMRNLNTHRAYRQLREARAAIRSTGKQPAGPDLAAWLTNYSEIPEKYGQMLRSLIAREKLAPFDDVRLKASD